MNYTLPDGIYYYNATIIDYADNVNSTLIRNITLDTIVPSIVYTLPTLINDTYHNVSNFIVNVSIVDVNKNN